MLRQFWGLLDSLTVQSDFVYVIYLFIFHACFALFLFLAIPYFVNYAFAFMPYPQKIFLFF